LHRVPHLFVNRPRLHDLTAGSHDLQAQFRWETINAINYKIGGIVFIIGSVLFFPRFEDLADLGAWTFFFGSLLYLVVTGHDFAECVKIRRSKLHLDKLERLEYVAAAAYLLGTILFTVGSIFFLSTVGFYESGAWCFVIGSLLFVLGACINVVQVEQGDTLLQRKLMGFTAITFVVGSVLFTVASIPYLWRYEAAADRTMEYAFLAWQYLVGSVLFFLGGVFNYWRAYDYVNRRIEQQRSRGT
jgi:hypothetical protein